MAARPGYLLELGRTPYTEAWDLQRSLAAAVSQGAVPETAPCQPLNAYGKFKIPRGMVGFLAIK